MEAKGVHARYGRILTCFWKNSLIRELTFRGHFIVNVISELLWILLLLVFIRVIFSKTQHIQGWNEYQYLFLMGTHLIVTSLFEAFFFDNCWRISHLVRTGDLDFVLVRPVNAQFLLSFDRVDYAPLANLLVGAALCVHAISHEGVTDSALLWKPESSVHRIDGSVPGCAGRVWADRCCFIGPLATQKQTVL